MASKTGLDSAKLIFRSMFRGEDDSEAISYLDEERSRLILTNAEYRSAVYCIAERIKQRVGSAPAGKWAALCHDNHHLWHAVFFALLKCRYNVLLLDAGFDTERIMQCMEIGGIDLIVSDRDIASQEIDAIEYDALTQAPFVALESRALEEQEPWGRYLAYCTSGTTGSVSKFPVHSMDMVLESIDVCVSILLSSAEFRKIVGGRFEDSSVLLTLPLNHNYGFEFFPTFRNMDFRICFYNTQSVLDIAAAVKEQEINLLPSVPLVWKTLLQILTSRYGERSASAFREMFGAGLRVGFATGSTMTDEMRASYANMGLTICNAYGASETPYAFIGLDPALDCFNIDMSSFVKRVRLSDGSIAEQGAGELLFKGGATFVGYLSKDGMTPPEVDKDGFIETGDYFDLSEQGARYLGRRKNMIACQNGKNVYPEDLESKFAFLSTAAEQYRIVGIDSEPALFVHIGSCKELSEDELVEKVKDVNEQLEIYKKVTRLFFSEETMPNSIKGVLANKLLFDYDARPEKYRKIVLVGRR